MRPLIDYSSDDEVRWTRLIIGTMQQGWSRSAQKPVQRQKYRIRSKLTLATVDTHQNKDRSCKGQFLDAVADTDSLKDI